MSDEFAIKIALLPEINIAHKIIQINARSIRDGTAFGPLGQKENVPHIPLYTGIIDRNLLPDLYEKVRTASASVYAPQIEVDDYTSMSGPHRGETQVVNIGSSNHLDSLRNVMGDIANSVDVQTGASQTNLLNFPDAESPLFFEDALSLKEEKFYPYISLRAFRLAGETQSLPNFSANKIVVARANVTYNTAERVLFKESLRKPPSNWTID